MTLQSLAELLGATLHGGDGSLEIQGVAPLRAATGSQLSFLSNPKYQHEAEASAAGAIIVDKPLPALKQPQLVFKNAYLAWARACALFAPDRSAALPKGIHASAQIHPTAKIGDNSHVGPNVVIGADTVVGNGCRIHAGVVIEEGCSIGHDTEIHPNAVIHYDTVIGCRCIIWSNAVIGAYGFGYAQDGATFVRIHQLGRVVIEDDVDIGAAATIDRGASGDTHIRRGTKIDNLVQIAHNVEIGEDSAIAAQVGIAGSAKIGGRVKMAGQVGIAGHIEIGDDTFIGAKAGIAKSFPAKSNITGYPARNFMEMRRIEAACASLPDLIKKVRALEARLGMQDSKEQA